jgi:cytochrome c2
LYLGDPDRGHALVMRYGCLSCHSVPNSAGPQGLVGPSLDKIGRRSYIAGRFPNEEIRMTLWLQNPQRLKPGTVMPNLNVGERDARDMAAYLATLR